MSSPAVSRNPERDAYPAAALLSGTRELGRLLSGERVPDAALLRPLVSILSAETAEMVALMNMEGTRRDVTAYLARLVGEMEALYEETRVLGNAGSGVRHLHRRVCRVEMMLEMLEGERVDPSARSAAPADTGSRPRPMGRAELGAFLGVRSWAVLSTSGPDGPYAVPVSYGFDGDCAFVACREGRKLSYLRASGAVCLSVVEVDGPETWRSAVLRGRAHELAGLPRLRGMAAIALQRERLLGASAADLARAARATVFRIDPTELTGRVSGG